MRYRLRTLLIVLAFGPPAIALAWWYGKVAIALLVLALLFCPDQLILAGQGLWALVAWVRSRNRENQPATDNRT